jgi:hypothetical protein
VITCSRGSEGPYITNVELMVDNKSDETLPATLQRLRGLKRLQKLTVLDPLAVGDDILGNSQLSGVPALSWDWVSALAEALGSWPDLKTLCLPTLCAMRVQTMAEDDVVVLGYEERPELPLDLFRRILSNLPQSLEVLSLGFRAPDACLVEAFRQLRARPLPNLRTLWAPRSRVDREGMTALVVGEVAGSATARGRSVRGMRESDPRECTAVQFSATFVPTGPYVPRRHAPLPFSPGPPPQRRPRIVPQVPACCDSATHVAGTAVTGGRPAGQPAARVGADRGD